MTQRQAMATGCVPVSMLVLAIIGWPGSGTSSRWRVLAAEAQQSRVLHFPSDRSIGRLYLQNGPLSFSIRYPGLHSDDGWEYFGEAMGDVPVPTDKKMRLSIHPAAVKDLSPLARLRPDDLYELDFAFVPSPGDAAADDRAMAHLGNLTALQVLRLYHTQVTDRGLRSLGGMKSLRQLDVSGYTDHFGDEGLAYVGALKSLEVLTLKSAKLTDAGLAHLRELSSLKELSVAGARIRRPGLTHLASLPALQVLVLWGPGPSDNADQVDNAFAGDALASLKNSKSLKDLTMASFPVTDEGLSHLAGLAGLESLSLNHTVITDAGLVHLAAMPSLKNLTITDTPITADGVAHIKGIKSLESLELPAEDVSPAAIADLAQLNKLKRLSLSGPMKTSLGDTGLKHLAALGSLETLSMEGTGITDAGMADLARLTNLKELDLTNLLSVGDKGLARLAAIKTLKHLRLVSAPKISTAGLNALNAIPGLLELHVTGIRHDGPRMDISALTQLRWLTLYPAKGLGDDDLACLANLKCLEWLQVQAGNCTDKGVAHLAGLTSLEILSLYGARLTGNALPHLVNMKHLEGLYLRGDFTDEDLSRLEAMKAMKDVTMIPEKDFSPAALDAFRKKMPNLTLHTEKPKQDKPRTRR